MYSRYLFYSDNIAIRKDFSDSSWLPRFKLKMCMLQSLAVFFLSFYQCVLFVLMYAMSNKGRNPFNLFLLDIQEVRNLVASFAAMIKDVKSPFTLGENVLDCIATTPSTASEFLNNYKALVDIE